MIFFSLLTVWCSENKLTLNPGKTEYIVFGTKHKLAKAFKIDIKINDNILREVSCYRYLGTILDQSLNASSQLSKLNQLMAQKLISFRKIRMSISERTAIILYKATILPIFYYNDLIYNLLTNQQQTKLQRLQNRALRVVFHNKKFTVAEMHTRAKIETLQHRRENHLLSLMFMRATDARYIDTTVRRTRRADAVMLEVPRAHTAKFERAPLVMGSKMWNDLPVVVRRAKTKLQLKNLIRLHRAGQPLDWEEAPVRNSNT